MTDRLATLLKIIFVFFLTLAECKLFSTFGIERFINKRFSIRAKNYQVKELLRYTIVTRA